MVKQFSVILLVVFLSACGSKNSADVILINGHFYTMVTEGDTIAALAIKAGKIIDLGSTQNILNYKNSETTLIDLEGHTVLPGFTDSHIHPISGGLALLECDLTDLNTADQIIDSIRNYAARNPSHTWIRGESMWLSAFKQGNPQKSVLDSIIPDRPVFISSSDGHNAWVNSKALALANITRETPDPLNGRIERDPITQEPSGTLRETAQDLVSHLLPKYTTEERKQALLVALQLANQYGLTSLVEASAGPEYIETYLELEKENKLTAHINISIYGDISKGMSMVDEVIALRAKYGPLSNGINLNQVKLFMDGVVEGKTAAMLTDYADDHHKGIANTSPDTAMAVIAALDKAGFQIHVHSIGDAATRMTLDAFEYALKTNGPRDSRHHIAHLHVIHPDDYDRFKSLGVIANIQALWATLEDSYMTELNFPYLGKERIEWQYPIGSLKRAGATLAFGSDWNVSTQNPFYCMQVAVTRRGPDSISRPPWTPQHLIDRYSVVHGYTANGAYLTFREKESGTLEKGKWADLIVLDQDPLLCDTFSIFKTKVLKTYFKGQLVYKED
ncbi:MAG: amidohydrolase [Saprospiraceae bacterium]|nr:amidohydrolase [Saprospiraceae bacterium]MBK6815048.1 amidohydrolase [Saprospiraceae bacterium]MBK8282128.1 amidohydrolase [Saprospiraceae bacterium]MBK8511055.1 amidohydrolase [Saprospiraceae bacterium]MBK9930075.1 amidohydrolase [Saprospiraceae bacterium]